MHFELRASVLDAERGRRFAFRESPPQSKHPIVLSEVKAIQFQLRTRHVKATDGVGVLRLRDAACFRTRHHYAQDDNLMKSSLLTFTQLSAPVPLLKARCVFLLHLP
jgi:hypothetical protein